MSLFDITDLATQTFLLRTVTAAVIMFAGIELFRSTHLINNERVMVIVYRAALVVILYFVARVMAALLDSTYQGIGWASNIVNIGFWVYILAKVRVMRLRLESEAIGELGRQSVSKSLDELIESMQAKKRELREELNK